MLGTRGGDEGGRLARCRQPTQPSGFLTVPEVGWGER